MMDREEFMSVVYDELHSDGDNSRANRIIDAADEYAECLAEHLLDHPSNLDGELDRLAEKYGTECLAEHLLDHPSNLADIQMAKAESEYMRGRHIRKDPHAVSNRLAMKAMAELKAAAPLEDQITGDPTLPEACVVDVLQRFLLAGEYFNPEIGASPTLELAIADAVAYIRELMDLHKVPISISKELMDIRKDLRYIRKVLAAQEDDCK